MVENYFSIVLSLWGTQAIYSLLPNKSTGWNILPKSIRVHGCNKRTGWYDIQIVKLLTLYNMQIP